MHRNVIIMFDLSSMIFSVFLFRLYLRVSAEIRAPSKLEASPLKDHAGVRCRASRVSHADGDGDGDADADAVDVSVDTDANTAVDVSVDTNADADTYVDVDTDGDADADADADVDADNIFPETREMTFRVDRCLYDSVCEKFCGLLSSVIDDFKFFIFCSHLLC